ncbi:GAD-like domain-containing protein [Pseudoduganella albidiflava]|uniref:DUF1851 domain-containing protein n=1 Tax=Pseudoduganella albidiflava TaxID=321983 RepID=A0A411X181_9BURK|nr:GAD-like domain-containing protein [Pseudoduganella albidiflava]QBI02734.1 DUF1851 domain-containing protein [Pseudoduganella albidiflava]GGY55868.1 hypothetical protein GCM10007387_42840 [Pseudoduganella albidiflava]
MNKHFAEFVEIFAPQVDRATPPSDQLDNLKKRLPNALIDFWTTAGWSGYADGLLWSTNPEEFAPALDAWLGQTSLAKQDEYSVVARSAFGKLFLWGRNSGMSVIINPHMASVTTIENSFSPDRADNHISAFFLSKSKDYFDFDDANDKPLFSRALRKLGPLKGDEMYAFAPACGLGGIPKLDNLIVEKIVPHLVFLAQLSEIEFRHLNVRRK